MKKTYASMLLALGLTVAYSARADLISNTFRVNGANVEMVASNTSDAPVTLVSIRLLGAAVKGKESPVLLALAPAVLIPAGQEATVVLGKAVDIRRATPEGAGLEGSKFCVGPIEPCLETDAWRTVKNIDRAIQTTVVSGNLTQQTTSAMPIHFVTNTKLAQ